MNPLRKMLNRMERRRSSEGKGPSDQNAQPVDRATRKLHETQRKSKVFKRARLILIALLVVGLLGAGVIGARSVNHRMWLHEERELGLIAYEAERYAEAIPHLLHYYKGGQPDPLVAESLAEARLKVPTADGKHISASIRVWRKLLEMEPKHREALEQLGNLYLGIGQGGPAKEQFRSLIDLEPENALWRLKYARACLLEEEPEQALEEVDRGLRLQPTLLRGHLMRLAVMRRLERPDQELVDYARYKIQEFPEDHRFRLVRAVALSILGRDQEGRKILVALAQEPIEQAEFARQLSDALASQRMHRLNAVYLRQANESVDDAELRDRYLWQLHMLGAGPQAMIQTIEGFRERAMEASPIALGLEAIARAASGEEPSGWEAPVQRLEALPPHEWQPWTPLLRAMLEQAPDAELIRVAQELEDYVIVNRRFPLDRELLGRTYEELDEPALALRAWTEAAQLSPHWALPTTRMAQIHLREQRFEVAEQAAREALRRNGRYVQAAHVLIQARLSRLLMLNQSPGQQEMQALGTLLERVEGVLSEPERLWPLRMVHLALQGRTDEVRRMIDEVQQREDFSGTDAQRLVTLLRRIDPEQAQILIKESRGNATAQSSPQAALREGIVALAGGAPGQEVRDRFERRRRQADPEQRELRWDIAQTQLLGRIDADLARQRWRDLVEQQPANRTLLSSAFNAPVNAQELTFRRHLLDRLEQVTPKGSSDRVLWRAQLTLQGSPEPQEVAKATAMLKEATNNDPTNVPLRQLLARCFARLDATEQELEQWQTAVSLQPLNASLRLSYARALNRHGRRDEALRQLQTLAELAEPSPRALMRASELLASLDRAELALRFRERAYGGAQAIAQDPPADLWLARLYAQDGQLEPAMRSLEALTRQALSPGEVTPSMSLPLLFNAAEMAHRLQRPELVDQLLSQVDRFDLPPMERTLRLARYQTRVGQLQASSLRLKSLLQEHPDSLQGARLLAINQLLAGELDEAMAVIRRALEEHPDHEPFKRLLMHEEMLEQNWRLNPVRALAPSLLEPTDEPNAQAAHRLFTLFAEHEERPQDTVRDLQQLLEEHRRLAPLWVLTLDRLYVWGEVELVESLIERMILEFPEQPLPAQILTRLRMSRQQWNQAAESAMLWRRRAGVGSRGAEEAEQAMAQAWLADGQAQRAVDLLADRFSQADRWDPNAPTLGLYLRALIRSGQQQRVEQQLITPLQQQPAAWLGPWTQAAKHLEAPQQTLAWLERVQPMVESLGPEHVQPRLVWASAFFELGARRARSESVRQRALDLAEAELHRLSQPPYDLPEALLQWTMIQGIHERWDTAIDGYERFLELRPDSAVAKNNLAMALMEKGSEDHARAQALAEEAVEQSSQRVEFVDTLARVYSHSQQWEKAQSAWRRVLEGLGSVDSRLFLAEALVKSGQTDEASQRLQDWTVDPQTLKADQRRRLASLRQRLGAATDQPQPATGP